MWEAEVLAELEDTNRIRQAYIQPKVDVPSVTVSKPKFSTEPWQPNVYAPEWNSDNQQPKSKTTIPDSVPPAGLAESVVTHNLGSSPDTNASYIFEGMLHSLNMPKLDIITFDGNPSCYWNFMHSFETNVEARVKDDKMRLTYLIQFCKGKARGSIEDCVLIRSGSGYKVAKGILAQQFGQNHQVTQALLEKVLEREQIFLQVQKFRPAYESPSPKFTSQGFNYPFLEHSHSTNACKILFVFLSTITLINWEQLLHFSVAKIL
ncbi:hypothetical protein HOLleu_15746 [Holothuria leucospilota]|uniref:Uncharacterized protein n=1 Tax=Holothuria leucospilota TaxID=206669 RepID=A0A9Q1C4L9_HOLLE|nr:hypothetical protein HOLleu_15746 [Holothuria leucospilota]